jgi:hypothetical protein
MIIRQSNNLLPDIRGIIKGEDGKNYPFDDCMAFLMERLDKNSGLDYWIFTGITGDGYTMVYNKNAPTCCDYCVSGYLKEPEYISYVFDAIGYEHTYITAKQINDNKTMYLQTVMAYIDKGVPVIAKTNLTDIPEAFYKDGSFHSIIVGYEDRGKTLLLIGDENETVKKYDTTGVINQNWIFAGEKARDMDFADIIRNAVMNLTHWLTLQERNGILFGAQAFRAWADDIENGKYDTDKDLWCDYGVYICNMATNAMANNSVNAPSVINKFVQANPKYEAMKDKTAKQYYNMGNGDGAGGIWKELEDLGGGFNITRDAIRDKIKRGRIAAKIREAALCLDEVVRILRDNLSEPQ